MHLIVTEKDIAAKRIAVVEIGSHNRGFQIKTCFHRWTAGTTGVKLTIEFLKSNVSR